jgi:hypothetical protein
MRISDLVESPIPDDWDDEVFSSQTSFSKMKKYVLDNAARLGAGSSRLVVEIMYQGRPTAFKVATNNKGIAQNKEEVKVLTDYYLSNIGITIPIIDYDETENPRWLHVEKAEKATKSFFKSKYGVDFFDIYMYAFHKTNALKSQKYYEPKNNLTTEAIELGEQIIDLCMSSTLVLGDLKELRNWGIYKNNPVIIDLGFTNDVKKLYMRR